MVKTSDKFRRAAEAIRGAKRVTAFTGAGISVESGIPPFRGEGGLWNIYDPALLEIEHFKRHPRQSWELLKKVFYDAFEMAEPNAAHRVLAVMEQEHLLATVITQNIDSLHQRAGNRKVYEFHGRLRTLVCLNCLKEYERSEVELEYLPPECRMCGGLLKPDLVLFGEPIPEPVNSQSFFEAGICNVMLVIGTSGEIMPACLVPYTAKRSGATIIEVNVAPSQFTHQITDIYLEAKATEAMQPLAEALRLTGIWQNP